VLAAVSAFTSQGTVWAALVQTSAQVWPMGVGFAQVHPSFVPCAHAEVHVAAGAGQGLVASVGQGVVAQAENNAITMMNMIFIVELQRGRAG
jgi:hypothetical protein